MDKKKCKELFELKETIESENPDLISQFEVYLNDRSKYNESKLNVTQESKESKNTYETKYKP